MDIMEYAPFGNSKKKWPSREAYLKERDKFTEKFLAARPRVSMVRAHEAWFSRHEHMGQERYRQFMRAWARTQGRMIPNTRQINQKVRKHRHIRRFTSSPKP